MKCLFSLFFFVISAPVFACSAAPSEIGCRMNIEIGPIQEISSGEDSVRGFRVSGSVEGYILGAGRARGKSFSIIDDDGAVTLTALYNVFATENILQKNRNEAVVLDNDSLKLMRQAADLGISYLDALPPEHQSPGRREAFVNLKKALANVGPSNRIPAGFIHDNVGAILRRTNQTQEEDSNATEYATYKSVVQNNGVDTLGDEQQLCVNLRAVGTGLRCTSYNVSGIGSNFCTRNFETGDVKPTSACPKGVQYQFGSPSTQPAAPGPSSTVSDE